MSDRVVHSADEENVEAVLREHLARGDAFLETVLPTLQHLIAAEDTSVFSDEILARMHGMLSSIVTGLLAGEVIGEQGDDRTVPLTRALVARSALLSHLHAIALEWKLIERLQVSLAIDPVMSPMLRSFISAPEEQVRGAAMAYLAAQARWCEAQRRMTLPLNDLPAERLDDVLVALRSCASDVAERVEPGLRGSHDENDGRLGLAARLISGLEDSSAALSIGHAGVTLFLTALARSSGQARDTAVFCTDGTQIGRLILWLRSFGLEASHIEQQILALHSRAILSFRSDGLAPELAARILESSGPAGPRDA